MKKYSKPTLSIAETQPISETIFLLGSGWTEDNCLRAQIYVTQTVGDDNLEYDVYQVDVLHGSNFRFVDTPRPHWEADIADHSAKSCFLIIEFNKDFPDGVNEVTANSSAGVFGGVVNNFDRSIARFDLSNTVTPLNPGSAVGMGNFFVTFNGDYTSFYPVDAWASDADFRPYP